MTLKFDIKIGFKELITLIVLLAYIILLAVYASRLGEELKGVLEGLHGIGTTIIGYYFGNKGASKVSQKNEQLEDEIEELDQVITENNNLLDSLRDHDTTRPMVSMTDNIKIKVERRSKNGSFFSSKRKHALIRIFLDTTIETRPIKHVNYILDETYKKRNRFRSNIATNFEILTSAYGKYDLSVIVTYEDGTSEIYKSDNNTWDENIVFEE